MVFQFHKGTIRTLCAFSIKKIIWQFQFHKGTIRTFGDYGLFAWQANFNSIKVRLELFSFSYEVAELITFQFHKGTIRTRKSTIRDVLFYVISIP